MRWRKKSTLPDDSHGMGIHTNACSRVWDLSISREEEEEEERRRRRQQQQQQHHAVVVAEVAQTKDDDDVVARRRDFIGECFRVFVHHGHLRSEW